MDPQSVDIIWNLTRLCPWDCSICCVDAVHLAPHSGRTALLRSAGLTVQQVLSTESRAGAFAAAASHLHSKSAELDLAGKLQVLEHLGEYNVRLDISGGDPLTVPDSGFC